MNDQSLRVLDWMLSERLPNIELPTFRHWKAVFDNKNHGWTLPVERAIVGGYAADRLAYAFTSGYQAALQRLVPDLPANQIAAFCITEEGGGHPRAIQSTLEESIGLLNGKKAYISCAEEASILLVAASTGVSEEGQNRLKIALVEVTTPGVKIETLADLTIIPEVSHGRAAFDNVQVKNVLPGDGYAAYIKPFRIIEDLHVFSAFTAYLYRLAHELHWGGAIKESLIGFLAGLIPLAQQNPHAPYVRIALSGIMREMNTLLPQLAWPESSAKERWERDKGLLHIADRVRAQQLENAWKHYQS